MSRFQFQSKEEGRAITSVVVILSLDLNRKMIFTSCVVFTLDLSFFFGFICTLGSECVLVRPSYLVKFHGSICLQPQFFFTLRFDFVLGRRPIIV
jgi:hypothetical protein